ncbi:DUF6544 family protein [Desulfovibrio litoralis]|uniref:Uncharacterized protein n=1 Tax=Desulfovibrio litoralis DSM 11393 TaxID=1121455 RepID=A0A1M7T6V8_9BACT|nr:DUF6544 family protein [Desulfovibrio litoralis]SHN66435.1 hypothetical protein SAMN02745728_01642 [Desulfovibrio litoralis DSM 11393]
MIWTLYFIILLIIGILIFFNIPYSKTKNNFHNDIDIYSNKFKLKTESITEQDIAHLPTLVQNYFRVCGYLGKTKMSSVRIDMPAASLQSSINKPPMKVSYTLWSFADEPVRLAYIKTSVFGIPFEVYDSTQNGIGFMKGVMGKVVVLFNQTGREMDKSQLLTYLAECFFIPSSMLSEYITWKPISNTQVEATINYKDLSASGIFTFNDKGFIESFTTDDRTNIGTDGSVQRVKWSAIYENFSENPGIYFPNTIKAIWHYKDGDLVYFDANKITVHYDDNI